MKCTGCGYENTDEAKFCSNCKMPTDSSDTVESMSTLDATASVTPVPAAAASAAPTPAAPYSPGASSAPGTGPAPGAAPAPYSSSAAPAPVSSYSPSAPPSYSGPPVYSSAPVRAAPYTYPQPYYQPIPQRPKQPFTITDAYIIIGFVLAVVGIFSYAFILLPASIFFSVVGFVKKTNARTLGLSIAGIVVGVVACLIKIGMVLNELGVIPDWLSAGIF